MKHESTSVYITFNTPGAKTSGVSSVMNFACIYVKHGDNTYFDTLTYPVSQDKLDEVTCSEYSGIGSCHPGNIEQIVVHGEGLVCSVTRVERCGY
jgi:hypothetical protein